MPITSSHIEPRDIPSLHCYCFLIPGYQSYLTVFSLIKLPNLLALLYKMPSRQNKESCVPWFVRHAVDWDRYANGHGSAQIRGRLKVMMIHWPKRGIDGFWQKLSKSAALELHGSTLCLTENTRLASQNASFLHKCSSHNTQSRLQNCVRHKMSLILSFLHSFDDASSLHSVRVWGPRVPVPTRMLLESLVDHHKQDAIVCC